MLYNSDKGCETMALPPTQRKLSSPLMILGVLFCLAHASTAGSTVAMGMLRRVIKVCNMQFATVRAFAQDGVMHTHGITMPQDVKGEEHMEGAGVKITRTVGASAH